MRTKANEFLSDFIVKQFDLVKYRDLTYAFLEIAITIEAMLNDEYYKIRFDSGGDLKVGGIKKPSSNQMDSMMIRDFQTKEKMQQVLLKYKMAYNSLNDLEKDVFKLSFIERLKDFDISISALVGIAGLKPTYNMIKNGECGQFSPKMMVCLDMAKKQMEDLADRLSDDILGVL